MTHNRLPYDAPPAPPPVSLLRRVARLSGVYVVILAALGLAVFVGSCAARQGWVQGDK